jgi:hypothetical protein
MKPAEVIQYDEMPIYKGMLYTTIPTLEELKYNKFWSIESANGQIKEYHEKQGTWSQVIEFIIEGNKGSLYEYLHGSKLGPTPEPKTKTKTMTIQLYNNSDFGIYGKAQNENDIQFTNEQKKEIEYHIKNTSIKKDTITILTSVNIQQEADSFKILKYGFTQYEYKEEYKDIFNPDLFYSSLTKDLKIKDRILKTN